jgi:nitrate reductase cytochrome c-type subunit
VDRFRVTECNQSHVSSCLQCETPNNVEEVDVPNVTVATFMDVRKFEQFLWKKKKFFNILCNLYRRMGNQISAIDM